MQVNIRKAAMGMTRRRTLPSRTKGLTPISIKKMSAMRSHKSL
jgi:hypothetical protein